MAKAELSRALSRKEALARAVKLLGPKAVVQDRGVATSPAAREQASAKLALHRLQKPEVTELKAGAFPDEMPYAEVIRIREQQSLAYRKWRAQEQLLVGDALTGYRYQVGVETALAFHVMGQGDSWEQALAAAEQEKHR